MKESFFFNLSKFEVTFHIICGDFLLFLFFCDSKFSMFGHDDVTVGLLYFNNHLIHHENYRHINQ